jgi:hypothetical protein
MHNNARAWVRGEGGGRCTGIEKIKEGGEEKQKRSKAKSGNKEKSGKEESIKAGGSNRK